MARLCHMCYSCSITLIMIIGKMIANLKKILLKSTVKRKVKFPRLTNWKELPWHIFSDIIILAGMESLNIMQKWISDCLREKEIFITLCERNNILLRFFLKVIKCLPRKFTFYISLLHEYIIRKFWENNLLNHTLFQISEENSKRPTIQFYIDRYGKN